MIKRILMVAGLMLACAGAAGAQTGHSVNLAWTASTDSGSTYNLYRLSGACPASGTAGFAKITATPVTGVTYTDSGVSAGAYCYYATAVLNGAESAPGNLASAVILPAAPTALTITGTK